MLQGEVAAFWRFKLKVIPLNVRVAVAQGLYRPQGYDRIQYGFGDPNAVPWANGKGIDMVWFDESTDLKEWPRDTQTSP